VAVWCGPTKGMAEGILGVTDSPQERIDIDSHIVWCITCEGRGLRTEDGRSLPGLPQGHAGRGSRTETVCRRSPRSPNTVLVLKRVSKGPPIFF
jgi:hypothetical protein